MRRAKFNKITNNVILAMLLSFLMWCIYLNVNANTYAQESATRPSSLEAAALQRLDNTIIYDGSYQKISYPGGDVSKDRGVCSDVIIRAYRQLDIDLQELVHLDMQKNFSKYPNIWGLSTPDSNIDHRRVPNLKRFFTRQKANLRISDNPDDYLAGDIVAWKLPNNLPHIGIVVSHKSSDGERPLIVHNIGYGTSLDDFLFVAEITGHYRYRANEMLIPK